MKGELKINGNEAKVKVIILITIWDTEGEDPNKGVGSTWGSISCALILSAIYQMFPTQAYIFISALGSKSYSLGLPSTANGTHEKH